MTSKQLNLVYFFFARPQQKTQLNRLAILLIESRDIAIFLLGFGNNDLHITTLWDQKVKKKSVTFNNTKTSLAI